MPETLSVRIATPQGPRGGLDVALEAGPRPVVLVGPNGAGKTTLLRLLLGELRPATGRIALGERVLFDAAAAIDLPTESRGLGYVPQRQGLFPHLSVAENVAFGIDARRLARSRAERARRIDAALAELGVASLASRAPAGLSGGERQRVALARALAAEPAALLLDEPLSALDSLSRPAIREAIAAAAARRGLPAILVTHTLADVPTPEAEVLVLEAGRVTQRGTLSALRTAPATPYVEALVSAKG